MNLSFSSKLDKKWQEEKFVCVGLDKADFEFNKSIIDTTFDLVCCYKPNSAFYEAEGAAGRKALEDTVNYIQKNHPDIPIILDAKRADISNTNEGYVKDAFDNLGVDAITVNPYLGKESLQPFLDRTDKGIFVLVKTSNEGAGEFQDLVVYPEQGRRVDGKPLPSPTGEGKLRLYEIVAEHASAWGGNIGAVVGATYPEQLKRIREIMGDKPILIPGIGAQGGDLEETIKAGLNKQGKGIIISASRSIIFAPNPRAATLNLTNQVKSIIADLSSQT